MAADKADQAFHHGIADGAVTKPRRSVMPSPVSRPRAFQRARSPPAWWEWRDGNENSGDAPVDAQSAAQMVAPAPRRQIRPPPGRSRCRWRCVGAPDPIERGFGAGARSPEWRCRQHQGHHDDPGREQTVLMKSGTESAATMAAGRKARMTARAKRRAWGSAGRSTSTRQSGPGEDHDRRGDGAQLNDDLKQLAEIALKTQ